MSDVDCTCSNKEEKTGALSAEDFDMAFEVLSDRDRRVMLHQLDEDEPMAVDELAEEMDPYVEADPQQIATALHQQHLPKMADTKILDYDSRSGAVRYYGHPFLEEVLDYTASEDLFDE